MFLFGRGLDPRVVRRTVVDLVDLVTDLVPTLSGVDIGNGGVDDDGDVCLVRSNFHVRDGVDDDRYGVGLTDG